MRFNRHLVLMLAVGVPACSSQNLHVRGPFDRVSSLVQPCGSTETFRVLLTTAQANDYRRLEQQLAPDGSGPVIIIDVDAVTLPPKFPWDSYETIGIKGPLYLERGSCSASGSP